MEFAAHFRSGSHIDSLHIDATNWPTYYIDFATPIII